MVGVTGIEPAASRSQSGRSTDELHPVKLKKCWWWESNPHAFWALALKASAYAIPPHQLKVYYTLFFGGCIIQDMERKLVFREGDIFMAKTLKQTLKEIQISLGMPQRKIAGTLKYYLGFLNVTEAEKKETEASFKKERMQTLTHKKVTWVDITNPHRGVIGQLAQQYPFHPLHLEDCISKGQFPKIEESDEDQYLFLLLRFPGPKADEGKILINQICFFLGNNYLVTIHEDKTDTISLIFDECFQNLQQREAFINNSSVHLLYTIIDQLTKDLSPILQVIIREVDEAEDIVFNDKVSAVYKVGQLRQKIISLRRVIGPLRVLLKDIEARVNKFSSRNLSVYFDNIIHRVEKAWETLGEAAETIEIYKDADFTFSSEKTNRILALLTIIFTFSIPATVIGTFYGMNILLPGGIESGVWNFWGDYTTLIIILLGATIPVILMLWHFKKRGWF